MNHRFHLLMPAKNAKGGWHQFQFFHLLMPAKNAKGGWHQFHQQKTQMVGGTNFTSKKRKRWVALIE
jgi:hypothetical protein